MCVVGCLSAYLASTHSMPVAPISPVATTKMSPEFAKCPPGAKIAPVEMHCSRLTLLCLLIPQPNSSPRQAQSCFGRVPVWEAYAFLGRNCHMIGRAHRVKHLADSGLNSGCATHLDNISNFSGPHSHFLRCKWEWQCLLPRFQFWISSLWNPWLKAWHLKRSTVMLTPSCSDTSNLEPSQWSLLRNY